jgi:amino acid permease
MSALGKFIVAVLAIIGLALIAIGIVYYTVKAGSLPSFFPGHLTGSTAHRNKHGLVAVVVGAVVLVISLVVASTGRRR